MSFSFKAAIGLLACILLGCARPASAQIASLVDESGKRVYVNAEPPASKPGSARNSAPAGHRGISGTPQMPREELERLVHETAERHQVDPVLVRAVIEAESNWNPQATSSKGAQGLMQLVPGTADDLGVKDAFDPGQNLDGGVRYLKMLLEKYDGDLERALAAYNAGPSAVERAGGVPNYRETRHYVQKVTDSYFRPGSGRGADAFSRTRGIYRTVDDKGRLVFTNE